ncbi:MAG: hypothetical protein J0L51_07055 [Rhizobiales bacterium]|nr:hypothetical protein [Hyphomicrobiales bacterium]
MPEIIESEAWWRGNITVTNGAGEIWYAVRRAELTNLKAGDILDVRMRHAQRNDTGWNVEQVYAAMIVSGRSPAGYVTGSIGNFGGTLLETVNGENVTPSQHYGSPFDAELYRVPAPMPVASVIMCVRARCSAANGNQVLAQLGDLQSLRIKRYSVG